jgi:hyperosmotically inducible protein
MKACLSLACTIALIALGSVASAAEAPADQRLADGIAAAVRGYPQFSIFDHVAGTVENGIVVLTGKVTMPYKKDAIERLVSRLDGVRELRSEIAVLPVSSFDDRLRHRVSRAIYGNPSFWNYAAMANPPIHIIVEHGRVTLTGVVGSRMERAMARSLATGVGELSVVDELRTDADRE